jgi:hypothetical protein
VLFIVFLCYPIKKISAQKTDTIVHVNGNILTGEFKKLLYGVVAWSMDGMGTISIEAVKINSIKSKKEFEVKTIDGTFHYGSFDFSGINRKVYIISKESIVLVNIDEIVAAIPIKKSFWMRTSVNLSLGANFSKGSNVGTIDFSGNIDYRKKKMYYNFLFDQSTVFQGDTLSSKRGSIGIEAQRIFLKRWGTRMTLGGSSNSELGSRLRVSLNAMGTKDIAYNSLNRLYAGVGLEVVNEAAYGDFDNRSDLAGVFTLVWKVYKFSTPKIWVDADMSYVPYFTDSGRYRTSFNLSPNVSVFKDDFKIGFTLYYIYDSKSVSESSENSDYGINLMFTYSLH